MSAPAMVTVYDGREALGFVLSRGKSGWEAFAREEVSLGLFPTQAEAANAVFDAAENEVGAG